MSRALHWLRGACIALATGLPMAAHAAGCELRVRWAEDPPYFVAANGHVEGLMAEVLTETLGRMDCRPLWVELPWARALLELQEGHVDVVAGALRRPEREAYAYLVDARFGSKNRLYMRAADAARIGTATTLARAVDGGLKLGVQIGVVYGPEYSELMQQPAFRRLLTQSPTRRSLWQMLDLGRVDGVLASEFSAQWELNQLGLAGRLVPTAVTLASEPTYVMLSRRSVTPAQVEQFSQAVAAMDRDGTLRRLVARYGGR